MTKYAEELDTATAVLAAARADRAIADAAEARLLQHAVQWAAMHSTDSIDDAATIADRYGDTGMPVAGEGAPLVAEFAITEFAAAIGVSTDTGRRYIGHALELAHRLPRVWRRVVTGDLRPYLARRVADQTLSCHPTQCRSWTGTSRLWRTRSDPSSSNASSTRRSPRTCPTWPRNGGWRRPRAGTSPSRPSRSPTTAPRRCTGSWTWPTPSTSSRRWPGWRPN